MERLDAEPDAGLGGVRSQLSDPILDLPPRSFDVLVDSGAADEDEEVGAQRGRLVDGTPVVVATIPEGGGAGGGKKPPRQRLETRRPASRATRALGSSPKAATLSRQSAIQPRPARTQPSTASGTVQLLTVIWLKLIRLTSASAEATPTLDAWAI